MLLFIALIRVVTPLIHGSHRNQWTVLRFLPFAVVIFVSGSLFRCVWSV
jgi:hypothetical protein